MIRQLYLSHCFTMFVAAITHNPDALTEFNNNTLHSNYLTYLVPLNVSWWTTDKIHT